MKRINVLVFGVAMLLFQQCSFQREDVNKESENTSETNIMDGFVLSCGSGCALNYAASKIEKFEDHYLVTFSVELYINEELSEKYEEKLAFHYSENTLVAVFRKGSQTNVLTEMSDDAIMSFKDFGKELVLKNGEVKNSRAVEEKAGVYKKLEFPIDSKKLAQKTPEILDAKLLRDYVCGSNDVSGFWLGSHDGFELFIVIDDCGDFAFKDLIAAKNGKIVSTLQIESESWLHEQEQNEDGSYNRSKLTFKINEFFDVNLSTEYFDNSNLTSIKKKYKFVSGNFVAV